MASFDFFTQGQGPVIPISLFGDAATQGIAAGKNLPTPLTAAIQGGIEGYKTGLGFRETEADIAIKEQQIEQAPVKAEYEREQLERLKRQNDIEALKARVILANEDLVLRQQEAELEAAASETERKAEDLKLEKEIADKISKGDKSVIHDPKYKSILIRNAKLAEGVAGTLTAQGRLTQDEQDNMASMIGFQRERELDIQRQRTAEANRTDLAKNAKKAADEFRAAGPFPYAIEGMTTDEEIVKRIEVFPKGTKQTENGKLLKDLPDVLQHEDDAGKFTVFKDGKLLYDKISETDATKFSTFKNSYQALRELGLQRVYGPGAVSSGGAPAPATPTTTPTPSSIPQLASPVAAPTPVVGNQGVVDRRRAEFDKLRRSPPPGIGAGTLEDTLRTYNSAIDRELAARSAVPAPTNVGGGSGGGGGGGIQAPVEQPAYQPPDTALSSVLKRPVTLNVTESYTSSPEFPQVADRVNAEPLLQSKTALIKGLAAVESQGFRKNVSPTGVDGLLQVTKGTAAIYGMNRDIPEQNVRAGELYLTDNLIRFKQNLPLALAAYNAGPGTIQDAIRATQSTDWNKIKAQLKKTLSEGKYNEVHDYPDRVIASASSFVRPGENDAMFLALLQKNNLLNFGEG